MKILVLITARGGSKRLPGKNVRLLGGKPLIEWSIEVAKAAPQVCEVIVSTDDPFIALICEKAGASVPWLRPSHLANDTASSVDVALHALDWYEAHVGSVDGLMLLQPTSPFRSCDTVINGVRLFQELKNSVIAVSEVKVHPSRCFNMDFEGIGTYYNNGREERKPAYAVNGSFYLVSPNALRKTKSFLQEDSIPIIIDNPREALDIDTEWDWMIAEAIVRESRSKLKA